MENVECVVQPPTNNNEAIPDVTMLTTTRPKLRHFMATVLYKKVFLVPTPPFRKKVILLFSNNEVVIAVYDTLFFIKTFNIDIRI
ncbi:hypothetical protein RHMOL_Rhmol05G0219200 [Rhododendron molle]|uniref:Uncharacterized protein n=1 Tax=Rhododendron molle TaxID=49168 RepID=A0ACC0NSR7_RHOML|nr:hypothetical protein RHMOL_Rhmol05G0219200 [Rhododendron molle]